MKIIFLDFDGNLSDPSVRCALTGLREEAKYLKYQSIPAWDSVGHMTLVANLEDAFESLIAAIFLDGGIEKARQFVLPFVISSTNLIKREHNLQDPKSILQEKVQETPGEKLQYVIVSESGPDHDKTFVCEARINSNVFGRGSATSSRSSSTEPYSAKIFALTSMRKVLGIFVICYLSFCIIHFAFFQAKPV